MKAFERVISCMSASLREETSAVTSSSLQALQEAAASAGGSRQYQWQVTGAGSGLLVGAAAGTTSGQISGWEAKRRFSRLNAIP